MSRTITINLLLVVIGIAIIWLVSWPFWERTQGLRASIRLLKSEIAAEEEAIQKLAQLERQVASSEEALERLQLAVPGKRDVASAIAIFEEVANVNGLALTTVQLIETQLPPRLPSRATSAGETQKPTVKTLGAQLKLEGRYGSLQSFLEDIELTFPLMDVADISFLVPPQAGSEGEEEALINPILEINLTLETYYR